MKAHRYLFAGLVAMLIGTSGGLAIANEEHHNLSAASSTVAADSAEAIAAYPLTTCVVSGDTLGDGDMGPPYNYVHKEAGKPDRLVRFCCKSCVKDFKKDPASYLKKIDEAAQAVKPAASGHEGHDHHE